MLPVEILKDLLKKNYVVCSHDSEELFVIAPESLEKDITREPGLKVEAFRIHPITYSITELKVTLCTDDLDTLIIAGGNITRIPFVKLQSKR